MSEWDLPSTARGCIPPWLSYTVLGRYLAPLHTRHTASICPRAEATQSEAAIPKKPVLVGRPFLFDADAAPPPEQCGTSEGGGYRSLAVSSERIAVGANPDPAWASADRPTWQRKPAGGPT